MKNIQAIFTGQMVPLDDALHVEDERLATPIEELMAREHRTEIIKHIQTNRGRMIFLLIEYGFERKEIAREMNLSIKTVYNIVWRIHKVREKLLNLRYTDSRDT